MKKLFVFPLLLLFSSSVLALPSWFKEGVYVKYALLMPEDRGPKDFHMFTLHPALLRPDIYKKLLQVNERWKDAPEASKVREDKLIGLFVYGDVFLIFRVVNVTGESALINVTLELYNISVNFWRPLDALNISTLLTLNLTDLTYRDEKGNIIGRPSFFIDPQNPPKKRDLIVKMSLLKNYGVYIGGDLIVRNVSYTMHINQTLLTYARNFTPPYITVMSNKEPLIWAVGNGSLFSSCSFEAIYDFDSGLMIGLMPSSQPSEFLALGIIESSFLDYTATKNLRKLHKSGEDKVKWWLQGFNLYGTNIEFWEPKRVEAPESNMKYFFIIGLLLLVIILVKRLTGERE
ncbi:hypothetical protein OCC_09044 [Thermococcus litoralis DSM 5473]|jgi:hypothetical protein|uniref:Uncharacterized protein n=1 Tax=Thermococcus litoralis (strain ATCC 51850 / DSM 5473 / JCM 8560 / NS-C) TaxID=523849 RepID=H3ZKC9_THELN|nr:hypothetical protein [Thermococcus litoralis]EHR79531.1 hypothetical protein OCC_09044 [Thermococcus litoralis DSM 5473]